MTAPFNFEGRVFGRLTVVQRVKTNGRTMWACRCDCGAPLTSCASCAVADYQANGDPMQARVWALEAELAEKSGEGRPDAAMTLAVQVTTLTAERDAATARADAQHVRAIDQSERADRAVERLAEACELLRGETRRHVAECRCAACAFLAEVKP